MNLLKYLKDNSEGILLAELGALLHDADKISYDFIRNTRWHTQKSEKEDLRIKRERWDDFFSRFDKEINLNINHQSLQKTNTNESQIKNSELSSAFVYHHHDKGGNHPLIAAIVNSQICGCDGIDSALDKIAPGDRGQQQEIVLKIDSPFGQFKDNIPAETELDNSLKYIYERILNLDGKFEDLKEVLQKYLGETRYPSNDVTLWAHSYSVATLTKATLAKILIEFNYAIDIGKPFSDRNKYYLPKREINNQGENVTDFTFLRICFDRYYLLSRAQSTTDVMFVGSVIESLQGSLREYISRELLIGNETYHDEEMQLFCIPKLGTWEKENKLFDGLHEKFESEIKISLTEKIETLLSENKIEELPFEISFTELNDEELKKKELNAGVKQRILYRSNAIFIKQHCCRQSPRILAGMKIGEDKKHGRCELCGVRYGSEKSKQGGWICVTCKNRRDEASKKRRLWILENDENVTPDSTETMLFTSNLSKCADNGDNKLVLILVSFDIAAIRSGEIFDNVAWGSKDSTKKYKKNPSPGRLYRCWGTLKDFFKHFEEGKDRNSLNVHTLNGGKPVFHIVRSPRSLQFVASACNATAIIEKLYHDYEADFGKFRSILPMSVGCIFFHDKSPLYVVLEAAKMMRQTLTPGRNENDKAITEYWQIEQTDRNTGVEQGDDKSKVRTIILRTISSGGFGDCAGPVQWRVPRLLSDNTTIDSFHPKFKLENNDIKHIDDLRSGDKINVNDGRFDFIFLDSAVRRFEIYPDGIKRDTIEKRKSYPITTWHNFVQIWKYLGMLESTQIKTIEGELVRKMHSWRNDWNINSKPWNNPTIRGFCEMLLFAPNAFGKKVTNINERDFLTNAAINGLLLDAIDFFVNLSSTPFSKQHQQINSKDETE